MRLLSKISYFSINQYFIILVGFLLLVGSHLLDYYPWILVTIAIFIIDFKHMKQWETILLLLFILSVAITWYFLDHNILYNTRLLGQFALMFVMYMIGLNIPVNQTNITVSTGKAFFYFLFIFFIGYTFSLIYSYFFIEQNNPLTPLGMHVCFQNEYKRTNVNGGLLVSTILTYYITFIAVLLPFVLMYFKTFKKNGFSYLELMLLLGLSLFSIFLVSEMGRRTTIVLFITIFIYLFFYKLIENRKQLNLKIFVLSIVLFIGLTTIAYYFLQDTSMMERLTRRGFHDRRYGFWIQGIYIMLDYPFGGGHDVVMSNFTKLAHNTWIGIGKDLGIVPFVLFLCLSFVFIYHIIRILLNKTISVFVKHIIMITSMVLFTILMIESVFNSDKTFFTYTLFLLGVVIALNNKEDARVNIK